MLLLNLNKLCSNVNKVLENLQVVFLEKPRMFFEMKIYINLKMIDKKYELLSQYNSRNWALVLMVKHLVKKHLQGILYKCNKDHLDGYHIRNDSVESQYEEAG